MIYITIDDKLYTTHDHALKRMGERNVVEGWIEQTMHNPDNMDLSPTGRMRYDKFLSEVAKTLRIVVDETTMLIITVHWLK